MHVVMRRNTSDWVNPKWKTSGTLRAFTQVKKTSLWKRARCSGWSGKDDEPRLFEHAQCNRIKRTYPRPQHRGRGNRISQILNYHVPPAALKLVCDESDATLPKIAIGTSARCHPNASSSSSSMERMIDMVFSTGYIKRPVYKGFECMQIYIVWMDIK